ncbi:MAG: long-chain fatty acid--CoA ligase [Bryobacteraceae bacterium]|nr:long-chain fatty acid--CoA ligase [Solibacteraceae bacterium]MCO5352180.1 long-chain fatty acid--CoA ligase [Bryobacteraceae bacterium]
MGKTLSALPAERRTVHNLVSAAAAMWGDAAALHQPLGGGRYQSYSWNEYRTIAEEIALGLRSLGVGHGDIVGLASETRAEFYLADVGVMTNGSVAAAVYTSLPPMEQMKTMTACEPKAVFIENAKAIAALESAGLNGLNVPRIVLSGEAPGALTLEDLRARGRAAAEADPDLLGRILGETRPADYCILYLTSGATGEPKMGLVTHNSLIANCDLGPKVLPVGEEDSTLAFLPSAHITQRMVMEMLMIRMGVPVWFSEGLSKMPSELRTVRPTFFVAPPRVWERVYASITTEIKKKPALARKLFYAALGVGSEVNRARQEGREPSLLAKSSMAFFNRVVFSKIRARLGGRMRIAASGAAPLGKVLAEFYGSIGMPLVEGYGLTEGGVVALNPVDRPVAGSIGLPLPGVEFKLAEDGELMIRSETLFSGYYKDDAASAAVLREGWLYTGDIASIDERGYVWITGRKKELIVNSNGKKIYPARIEALFKTEPLVNQIMLLGDDKPFVCALFTINPAAAEGLPGLTAGDSRDLAALVQSEAVQAEMKRVVGRINKQLADFEQIRKFRILEREFSIETGEITPTMKLRRGKVLENYRELIAGLYPAREEMA